MTWNNSHLLMSHMKRTGEKKSKKVVWFSVTVGDPQMMQKSEGGCRIFLTMMHHDAFSLHIFLHHLIRHGQEKRIIRFVGETCRKEKEDSFRGHFTHCQSAVSQKQKYTSNISSDSLGFSLSLPKCVAHLLLFSCYTTSHITSSNLHINLKLISFYFYF